MTASSPVRPLQFEVFHNTCAKCGHRFDSLVHHLDDGILTYRTDAGDFRYLDSSSDPVWAETEQLVELVIGHRIAETPDARIFHRVLAQTCDSPPSGKPFRSAWEKDPCSTCGSQERSTFGPYIPLRAASRS